MRVGKPGDGWQSPGGWSGHLTAAPEQQPQPAVPDAPSGHGLIAAAFAGHGWPAWQYGPSVIVTFPVKRPRHHRAPGGPGRSWTRTRSPALAAVASVVAPDIRLPRQALRDAVTWYERVTTPCRPDGCGAVNPTVKTLPGPPRCGETRVCVPPPATAVAGESAASATAAKARRLTYAPPLCPLLPARRSSSALTKPSRSPSSTRWTSPIS
ncbi:MAG: hypothetical protein QOF37_2127 [Thermoleophilaceae bacterium]|nr:hypothetical protein [Thermoleophilaceae bacterium]